MEAIRQVIEDAYIRGIHRDQDEAAVRAGFHETFCMYVNRGDEVVPVTTDEWLPRVEQLKAEDPELWSGETEVRFDSIDACADCAMARLTILKAGRYFSTDYMLLYRLTGGWRIVAKAFTVEQP